MWIFLCLEIVGKESEKLFYKPFFFSSRNCLQATYFLIAHFPLILPPLLSPSTYLEGYLAISPLVSLTVSSQLLLFLELQLEYWSLEAYRDPPGPTWKTH